MVDAVTDYAIFHLDPEGFVFSWNAGARVLKGYEAHEVIGKHFSMFYPQELLAKGWPAHEIAEAKRTGRFEDEGWRIRKDGSRFWANIVITRLIDSHGVLRGFSKITRDLTERKRQEELLRGSEERFRLLVEGVQDYAIYMLDPSGYVASWNAGAQKTKGYTAAQIIGKHFSTFYPEDIAASGWPDEELRIALRDGRFEDEGWRIRKDGSRFWANVVITSLIDESGRHRGFAKVTQNLTEKKRVHVLEDEGRRITTFLAMLGHELRNPLAPISNALVLLEQSTLDSRPLRVARDVIGRQVRQMTRLVDDLLDVGRISSGKIHLEMKLVELGDAISQAVETTLPAVKAKSQILNVSAADKVWISGDRARIVQVICNLLNNAAKFTPPGGQIDISLHCTHQVAELSVKDNGPGIVPSELPRIFELFSQGEQDTARSLGGLGLGLSLVQQLVTLHGGDVSAFSKGIPGEGAEFVIHLPCVAAPPKDAEDAQVGDNPKAVLVVDDNRDSADTLAMLVEDLGYEVTVAYDGNAAIELVKHKHFSALLLDLGLPGLSGIEVAQHIAATLQRPPAIIAVTGYIQANDRDQTFKNGFYAHLAKPVDVDQLVDVLQRATAIRNAKVHGAR
ncbi:MAG: sensor hybrid histidine kinase [Polaromonas sp.]|nr:sensor hybrid histidine kinase [Polaromonas sp.]